MRAIATPKYRERVIANSTSVFSAGNNVSSDNVITVFQKAVIGNLEFTFFTGLADMGLRKDGIERVTVER